MRNCSPACPHPDGVLNSNSSGTLQLFHDGEWIHSFGWTAPLAPRKLHQLDETCACRLDQMSFITGYVWGGESCPVVWGQWSCPGYLCNERNLTNKVILVNCSVGLLISIDPMCWAACLGVWSGGRWCCCAMKPPTNQGHIKPFSDTHQHGCIIFFFFKKT